MKPFMRQLAKCFINILELVYHVAVNMRIVETGDDFEAVIVEAKIGERRVQQKDGEEAWKRHSLFQKYESTSEEDSSSSYLSDIKEGGKNKKKKTFRVKKRTLNMLKGMQALVDELKKIDNNNQGGF